jgi:hypothetical protein
MEGHGLLVRDSDPDEIAGKQEFDGFVHESAVNGRWSEVASATTGELAGYWQVSQLR